MQLLLCFYLIFAALGATNVGGVTQSPWPMPEGDINAVYSLLQRVVPSHRFSLHLSNATSCCSQQPPCFCVKDDDVDDASGATVVTASSISDMTAGIGWYLRHSCNMTIGWPRGGGSSSSSSTSRCDALQETTIARHRNVPINYLMNVCTHSYSLVWYSWQEWEAFIDWLALSGINMVLALTGQEEIQYRVFTQLGLSDADIRSWFNGPAFLTWSRGQNEYGSNIAGPLPRSFMRDQHQLQQQHILPRLRSLGIVGQLPAFQGNVPIQLKDLYQDANITQQGETGWMNSLDPLFQKIAKLWMEIMIKDFGTDHWYQLDGYFDGGTAPWMYDDNNNNIEDTTTAATVLQQQRQLSDTAHYHHNISWYHRGVAAYESLNSTDPEAVWSFQGFAVVGWDTPEQASYLKGFIDSAPLDKFVIIDMAYHNGQWMQWDNASFFGAPFVWTALHDFGGTDGIKGDMERINHMPFAALEQPTAGRVIGTGGTPEGIDQNPAFYEFLHEQPFRSAPIGNLTEHMIERSHRRYQLKELNNDVAKAWKILMETLYATDRNVKDFTGVTHLSPRGDDLFEKDRSTPKTLVCKIYKAWGHLIQAGEDETTAWADGSNEPFRYDLVNLGREVLAQISTPMALNFTVATQQEPLLRHELWHTAFRYTEILFDLDELVATESAFLLGPWLQLARRLGEGRDDCSSSFLNSTDCQHFYEWNARSQITTWNPTGPTDTSVPGGPIDYAAKQWAGLIKDYYGQRAKELAEQAFHDYHSGSVLNQTAVAERFAKHAYRWTTSTNPYPNGTVGDALTLSRKFYEKYEWVFHRCP